LFFFYKSLETKETITDRIDLPFFKFHKILTIFITLDHVIFFMNSYMKNFKHYTIGIFGLSGLTLLNNQASAASFKGQPNILWILIEDASCHISCYGEKAIQTPNIDALANDGVRFENAFVTSPVCSPSRSALVTGMYQTTTCSHNHRSQRDEDKGSGNKCYYESYNLPADIPLASKLFESAGYYTCNETIKGTDGKQDYNFVLKDIYTGTSWKNSPEGIPFFAQIQLHGGKNRKKIANTENFTLPPYYYEDSIMRYDWKSYLGSWLETDKEVQQIITDLKAEGVYDNTLIFLLSDHGISHLRGKQFLYDEGIKVPLIVKFPEKLHKGTTRNDMVKHIDILPSSLAYAGIPIPENIQGVDIFSDNYKEQEYIYACRDRCDETIEIIRSVRTKKYKYIRNFLSYRPYAQRNQYKDEKKISIHNRELYQSGKLNEIQSALYQPTRPVEELYDIVNDPFEINNLALDPDYDTILDDLRSRLYEWMAETNDPGLIPEPILEELGKEYGHKTSALQQMKYADINERLIHIIESGEKQNNAVLLEAIYSQHPSERYWAVTWLGVNKAENALDKVEELTRDNDPSVRIAANLALYKIDPQYDPITALGKEVSHKNLIVGMYAMSAIEQTGIRNDAVRAIAEKASESDYDFTRRYGNYLKDIIKIK
jgi:arylsulfatase A-like enzyme